MKADQADVQSRLQGVEGVYPVPLIDLQKHFRIGDHIKVIAGKFKGETGTIRTRASFILSDIKINSRGQISQ